MLDASLMILGGFLLLGIGGEALVAGAVSLAKQLNVPPLLIGFTLVALGTSAPELMVSVRAVLDGQPDIAIGNVVGSNIANILLVLGAAALARPILADSHSMWRDAMVMLSVTTGFVFVALWGQINTYMASAMLVLLVLYIIYAYRHEKNKNEISDAEQEVADTQLKGGAGVALPVLLLGIGGVVWGADVLVTGAVLLAQDFGISQAVIGLSLVAFGTSLPELAISMLAVWRGHASVAIGNILGSNVSNILLILGVTGLIEPLAIAPEIVRFDIWVMLIASFSVLYFLADGAHMSRRQGGLCLGAYAVYIAFLYMA